MRTATITIQLDTSNAPLSEDAAREVLGDIVDSLGDIVYVSSAFLD